MEIHVRKLSIPVTALLLISALGACGGKKEPVTMPSQTATQAGPQIEPPPQLPPPIRQLRPTRPTTVKVLDPGGPEKEEAVSLFEASERAKAAKASGSMEAVAEINDENLSEYSADADIIMLEGAPAAPPPGIEAAAEPAEAAASAETRDEQYWRNGVLEIRMNWRRSLDRIDELELESAALRQQFYAEEDPYVRDNHVKPDWDRVLDRLAQLKDRSDRYELELERILDEGRLAGAQPGWLAEGWELEPEKGELKDKEPAPFSAHQTGEPQVVDEVIDP
jgi:hypothetical protein